MKKICLLFISFTFLQAKSLPLVHYDPFYKSQTILHVTKHKKVKKTSLHLNAIFNNQAFIHGKFYKKGDKIRGYKIKKIYKQSIILQSRREIKILRLQKQHLFKTKKLNN